MIECEVLSLQVVKTVVNCTMFFDKCRLCLDSAGTINIFEERMEKSIYDCTGVTISTWDNLPQKICELCLRIVRKAQRLRELAVKNNHFLHELFDNDSDAETIIVTTDTNEGVDTSDFPFTKTQDKESSALESLDRKQKRTKPHKEEPRKLIRRERAKTSQISVKNDLHDSSTLAVPSSSYQHPQPQEQRQVAKLFVRLDNGSTEYECGTCGKRYGTWKKLYHHQRQHNKTLQCPLDGCGKMFASKADLKKHERTHTGERPYSCKICKKTFTQKCTLKAHQENIHNMLID